MANPNVTLSQLAAGMLPSTAFQCNDQNSCAPVCEPVTLVQVANVKEINNISLASITPNETCYFEEIFHNNTEAPRNIVFNPIVGGIGDYLSMPSGSTFGTASAVDFVTFLGENGTSTSNGGTLQFINRYVDQIPVILGGCDAAIIIQANTPALARSPITVFTIDASGNSCPKKLSVPMCDFCPTNSDTGVFTAGYAGPMALGKNVGFYIRVPSMTPVTDYLKVRLNIMGQESVSNISSCGI